MTIMEDYFAFRNFLYLRLDGESQRDQAWKPGHGACGGGRGGVRGPLGPAPAGRRREVVGELTSRVRGSFAR